MNEGVSHSTKELAIGNPHSPHPPSASPDRICPIGVLGPSVEGRGPAGGGAGGKGRPDGLQCSRCGMPSCGFTWPVAGVCVCPLHQRSHGCAGVCVCVCPAPAQSQACKCVHVCPASAQALRHLGSIPLLRAPSPPGPLFSLTQVTFQPFPSPLFLPRPPAQPTRRGCGWSGREGASHHLLRAALDS